MAKSVLETLIKIIKAGNGDKEAIKSLAELQSSINKVTSIMGGLVAVGASVYAAFKNTAGVFIDYAAQVRDLSRVTGMSVDQTSRLIQVADDAKVSYESLQKALWFAAKSGIEPNIDTISRLADEYVALGDPVKQAELLTKNFGKGGAEMGKLLEMGSEGIKKLNAGINQNLILTEKAVVEARKWEIQQDNFNDAVEGTKVAIGQGLLGVLDGSTVEIQRNAQAIFQAANGYNINVDKLGRYTDAQRAAWEAAKKQAEQQWILANSTDATAQSTVMLSETARDAANAQREQTDAMAQTAEEAQALADKQKEVMDVAFQLQSALDSYNETMTDVNAKQSEAQAVWDEAQAKYDKRLISTKELKQAEEEYNTAMAETGAEATKAAAVHQEAMNRIIFSIIQAQAASDGLTAAESKGLLQIAVQLGMVDQTTADLANQMVDSFGDISTGVRDTNGALFKMNEEIFIARTAQGTYNYKFVIRTIGSIPNFSGVGKAARDAGIDEFGAGGSGGGGGGYASGGQWGGEWATVGEQGTELISPSGYIFPADVTKQLLASGIVPSMGFAAGGAIGAASMSAGSKVVGLRGASIREKINSAGVTSSTSSTSAAVIAASQEVAKTAEQNAQTNASTQNEMQAAQTATVDAITASNNDLISEVKAMNQNIEKLNDTTVRAIREIVVTA